MTATVAPLPPLPLDDRRGSLGMLLFIATEAFLFLMLFFAYYYLGADAPRWPAAEPPKLRFALPMLAILAGSSLVLHWGERQLRDGAHFVARVAVLITIAIGAAFLILQSLEYREHLRTLTPRTNAYGSIFYTLTSFHAAHLVLGICMLAYVLLLPLGRVDRPPHRPLHNAALYWHFVDLVWICIVALLYLAPNVTR
jgi:heme/copper-type cytochrome/quinol oxidase subunit 3